MAKSDSFFIRAGLTGLTGNTYTTTSIDLGPYVDALAKTVLRIHNISVQYNFANLAPSVVVAGGEAHAQWQLTTQDQAGLVLATDRSVVSSGQLSSANAHAVANSFSFVSDTEVLKPTPPVIKDSRTLYGPHRGLTGALQEPYRDFLGDL